MNNKVEITFKPEPTDSCSTYYQTAQYISTFEEKVGSTEWIQKVAAAIKKFGHHEKLSVYERVQMDLKYPDVTLLKEFVDIKVETHKEFSERPLSEQIFGQGNWLK